MINHERDNYSVLPYNADVLFARNFVVPGEQDQSKICIQEK